MEEFLRNSGFSEPLINAVHTLGYKHPTAVQSECIPLILKGEEVKAKAPTGTGKTAAFALPILELLRRDPYSVFALVISPTRELALQINDQFKAFGSNISVKTQCIVGGVDILRQAQALTQIRPHIVIGTPGRLNTLLSQPDILEIFSNLQFLVLDECDFLEESQKEDLDQVKALISPSKVLNFSATLDEGPTLGERANIKEYFLLVPDVVKDNYLIKLLERHSDINIIVFTQTCPEAFLLSKTLEEMKISVLPLHSLMSQHAREASLHHFRSAKAAVLVATDVAARGLDLPQVRLVINHHVPRSSKTYLHRIGRTGRAGRGGMAITLVTQFEVSLVLHIEKKLNTHLEELYNEEEMKILEDEVVNTLNKVTNIKAVISHRVKRPSLDNKKRKELLVSKLKKIQRLSRNTT
ncbi:unnamed protein product [Blepharisma stoltei]|uniref:RNA helicase n=1 Tax=Blepharisma stoltei TaxID=1481888 RepID=A0AAU9JYT6_9CILI|nr:unnamed protein product [Blepharisma stoltei]